MFEGFTSFDVDCGEAVLHGVRGGTGPPLLLLHGYPQTHAMWHRVAPQLARSFTVVAPDLRGYGRSSKPPSQPDHASYSKRVMANDLVTLMSGFGFDRYGVCGHDRGGRVGHRMAVDWPDRVSALTVLDIAPTREMYRGTTMAFARAYWHWFFLIQPAPLPESLIEVDPDRFWLEKCVAPFGGAEHFDPEALEDYLAAFRNPETVRATCEDYRAAASIDLEHDDADGEARIDCPVLALWAADGVVARCFDPLALWRKRATRVTGKALAGGHYLAEENPGEVLAAIEPFFTSPTDFA